MHTMHRLLVAVLATALCLPACRREEAEPPPAAAQGAAPSAVVASIKGALSVPDPLARAATLSAVLQGLGPDAVGEVADAYDDLTEGNRDSLGVETALLAEWWARHDPAGAFDWFRARPWLRNRNPMLSRVIVRAWATRDPAAARARVESTVGRDQLILVAGLVEGWFASGQDGVEDYLIALPPGVEQQYAIAGLARRRVLRDGIDATFRWAEALPDDAPGRFKLQAHRRVATAVAEVDPERAAAWVERQLEGDFWDGLAQRVAILWAERDGRAAMAWLATLPPEKLGLAVGDSYRVWLSRDPEGARAWVQTAHGQPALEPAISFYALSVVRDDPQAALAWAAKITDEQGRRQTLFRIGRIWLARDPEAAKAWLEASELSPMEREQVLNPPQKRRAASPPQQEE